MMVLKIFSISKSEMRMSLMGSAHILDVRIPMQTAQFVYASEVVEKTGIVDVQEALLFVQQSCLVQSTQI